MRLFTAIEIPESIKKKFITPNLPEYKKKIKWAKNQQIHLTLNFLDEKEKTEAEQIENALKKVDFSEFKLTISKCGFFPNSRKAKVFWLGFEDSANLKKLKADIDFQLSEFIQAEKRKFIQHITLARIKYKLSDDNLNRMILKAEKLKGKSFNVNSFCLFQSILNSKGAVHRIIRQYQ